MSNPPDILDVFEHYGARVVGRGGEWQKAFCPLLSHEDRNPSASVNVETGKWQCFSCDGYGDVYDIIERNEGLAGFADAQRWAEENLAGGSRAVRPQRGSRGGLSVRPTARKGARNWQPPWRVL